jgi:hypothetical protein
VSLRIVVSGMTAGTPGQGGAAWAVLQYVLGLRRLGHDVLLAEPVADPADRQVAGYFDHLVERFGLHGRAALVQAGGAATHGMERAELRRFARSADLLLNVSGMLRDPELLDGIATRAFLDLDPGFTQLWYEAEGVDMGFALHNRFVTIGGRIGSDGCGVPTCGLDWIPTLQPIVLDEWPAVAPPRRVAFTTVGHWRSYGSIWHGGVHYGQKAHSLRPLFALPAMTEANFSLALGIDPGEHGDLEQLNANGWGLVDPAAVASTPDAYASFVRSSWAELGLAKSGYVAARCGWFSDRSICYLASGRPVLAQDTGFGRDFETGAGVLAFSTLDDAAAAVEAVRSHWARHSRAARALAEDVFDSDRVLTRLVECL